MSRPDPRLIELAARQPPALTALSDQLVDSAVEHRMWGLLHTWATSEGLLEGPVGDRLAALDAHQWARNRLLGATAAKVTRAAEAVRLPIAFLKGVTLEAMAYTRLGERPTTDLDILVPPGYSREIVALVEALHPDHRWLHNLEDLVSSAHIQSIDLVTDGIPVDIHLDPLKLEIVDSRHPEAIWERTTAVEVADSRLPCLDVEASLALAIVHLHKDRFRYLLGYADIARLMAQTEDWAWIERLGTSEGLAAPMRATLATVTDELGIANSWAEPVRGLRRALWKAMWPERIQLMGSPGRVRHRYRQMFIPLVGSGRVAAVARGWLARLFPPRALLDAYYPDSRGPYLWKALAGRLHRRRERRRQRRRVLASTHDSTPPERRP